MAFCPSASRCLKLFFLHPQLHDDELWKFPFQKVIRAFYREISKPRDCECWNLWIALKFCCGSLVAGERLALTNFDTVVRNIFLGQFTDVKTTHGEKYLNDLFSFLSETRVPCTNHNNFIHDDWHVSCSFTWWVHLNVLGRTPLLTHWGRDKTATISQTTFSSAFSWMEIHGSRLMFHWILFLRVKLTIFKYWFR